MFFKEAEHRETEQQTELLGRTAAESQYSISGLPCSGECGDPVAGAMLVAFHELHQQDAGVRNWSQVLNQGTPLWNVGISSSRPNASQYSNPNTSLSFFSCNFSVKKGSISPTIW